MIITKNENFRNSAKFRLKIKNRQEALHIKYLLKAEGLSLVDVGQNIGIQKGTVLNVVAGRRRSRKVETEIARILGKESWNDVVIEARLAVTNPAFRPSQKDIDEYKQQIAARLAEIAERKAKMREELAPMREAVKAIRRGR